MHWVPSQSRLSLQNCREKEAWMHSWKKPCTVIKCKSTSSHSESPSHRVIPQNTLPAFPVTTCPVFLSNNLLTALVRQKHLKNSGLTPYGPNLSYLVFTTPVLKLYQDSSFEHPCFQWFSKVTEPSELKLQSIWISRCQGCFFSFASIFLPSPSALTTLLAGYASDESQRSMNLSTTETWARFPHLVHILFLNGLHLRYDQVTDLWASHGKNPPKQYS